MAQADLMMLVLLLALIIPLPEWKPPTDVEDEHTPLYLDQW